MIRVKVTLLDSSIVEISTVWLTIYIPNKIGSAYQGQNTDHLIVCREVSGQHINTNVATDNYSKPESFASLSQSTLISWFLSFKEANFGRGLFDRSIHLQTKSDEVLLGRFHLQNLRFVGSQNSRKLLKDRFLLNSMPLLLSICHFFDMSFGFSINDYDPNSVANI